MKKALSLFFVSSIMLTSTLTILACSNQIYGTDVAKISDYSWKKEEPYFAGYQSIDPIFAPEKVNNLQIQGNLDVQPYFSLKDMSTSFKTTDEIKKQTATSAPLNSKFLPNGNLKSDFSIVKRTDFYSRTNELKDWKFANDLDAKYNASKIPLQKSEKTMEKWVESQDENTKEMNMNTVIESTSMENTIIGNKRMYERSFNNYQYNDVLVSWAGAASEGIIVPPGKNQTEKAHLNGTKILGNIFLDGYNGLTSEILKGFLLKNDNGEYLIVDVLIDLALKLGFDGWFWNNEPNGSQPNGFIVDNEIMYQIMGQMQTKIKNSSDPKVRELIIFGYKNQGILKTDEYGNTTNPDSEKIFKNTNQFLNDFYVFSNETETYIKHNKLDKERFNIFNMYNTGAWVGGKIWLDEDKIGKKDLRDLNYIPFDKNGKPFVDAYGNIDRKRMLNAYQLLDDQYFTYKTKQQDSELGGSKNSIALFASHVAYDLASQKMDAISSKKSANLDTYGMVVANDYDDRMYTGSNKYLSDQDIGVTLYPGSERGDKTMFENKSYGVGNLVQEKTVLIDSNDFFKTNFSTGQGNQFVTLDDSNHRVGIQNYPWSNTNIADVQPTYKWDIQQISSDNSNQNLLGNISGYYDYYNPYLKGNSITLGSGYTQDGKINPAIWAPETTYLWNIMGANYKQDNPKHISMTLRVPKAFDNEDIKIKVSGDNNLFEAQSNLDYKVVNDNEDYKWVEITGEFAQPISKIGVEFKTPKEITDFNISCGQLKVTTNLNKQSKVPMQKADNHVYIESVVKRGKENFIRFSLEENQQASADIYNYYEVYYQNELNQLIRITENNTPHFYLKNVNEEYQNFYIKQIDKNNEIVWSKFKI